MEEFQFALFFNLLATSGRGPGSLSCNKTDTVSRQTR